MAKPRQVFVCRSCGGAQSRWLGKCPDCGTWDSLEAQTVDTAAGRDPQKGLVEAWSAPVALGAFAGTLIGTTASMPGLPAQVGVFVPVLMLIPGAILAAGSIRS